MQAKASEYPALPPRPPPKKPFCIFDPTDNTSTINSTLDNYIKASNNQMDFSALANKLRYENYKIAMQLKTLLCNNSANLVTIESVTSGMIGSTLTDVGGSGSNYYGGFIVYDTDAKRLWANVRTGNLYNKTTAEEMALGALKNSRATVALSITGNASSYFDSLGCLGVADVGVAYYNKEGTIDVETQRIEVCKEDSNIADSCSKWAEAYKVFEGRLQDNLSEKVAERGGGYPTVIANLEVNQLIRLSFTKKALEVAVNILQDNLQNLPAWNAGLLGPRKPPIVNTDEKSYLGCGEPNKIIYDHLLPSTKEGLKGAGGPTWPKFENISQLCSPEADQTTCPINIPAKAIDNTTEAPPIRDRDLRGGAQEDGKTQH